MEFDTIIKIELKTDSANSYVHNSYLEIQDLSDEISLLIENTARSIRVTKIELLKALSIFEN